MDARTREGKEGRDLFYGCSTYQRRGSTACHAARTVSAQRLETLVVDAVAEVLLRPQVVQDAVDQAVELLTSQPKQGREALADKLDATTRELAGLVRVAARVGDSEAVVQAIRAAEATAKDLRYSLTTLDEKPVALDQEALRQHSRDAVASGGGIRLRGYDPAGRPQT